MSSPPVVRGSGGGSLSSSSASDGVIFYGGPSCDGLVKLPRSSKTKHVVRKSSSASSQQPATAGPSGRASSFAPARLTSSGATSTSRTRAPQNSLGHLRTSSEGLTSTVGTVTEDSRLGQVVTHKRPLAFTELGSSPKRMCATPMASSSSQATPASTMGVAPPPKPAAQGQPGASSCTGDHSGGAVPACAVHGQKALSLKRVRKDNCNRWRLFFSCAARGCNHFQWADLGFPHCRCGAPGPLAVLRVSKKEASSGRWFFSCRGSGAGTTCNFFAWATPADLRPLGGLLSPLT